MKQIQKDSLFNEYKGNLFEFLVAQKLASYYQVEGSFLSCLGPDFFAILQQQETYLAQEFPLWKKALIEFSEKTAKEIFDLIKIPIKEVLLIGKKAAASGDERFFEADILLRSEEKDIPLSLKLSKHGAFVNTKSAGLKSFLAKYFSKLEGKSAQKDLDEFVLFEFENLSRVLHQEEGIEYAPQFKYWQSLGLPIRPGELQESSRQKLHEYYHKLNQKLYELLLKMQKSDPKLFTEALAPLMGASSQEVFQITCYYKTKEEAPLFHSLEIETPAKRNKSAEILPLKADIGNFTIQLEKKWLQIRIKPMKTFIQPAFKVNCSVKTIN